MRKAIVVAGLVCLLAGPAAAQVEAGDGLVWFNGGAALGKGAKYGETINGVVVSFAYEKREWDAPTSVGISIGYAEIDDEVPSGNDNINYSIRTIPFYLGGKYWFGQSRLQGYAGLALGIYLGTQRESTVGTPTDDWNASATGFGLGVPVGAAISLSDSVLLNVNYTFNWLWGNDFLKNDALHTFSIGIGFKT